MIISVAINGKTNWERDKKQYRNPSKTWFTKVKQVLRYILIEIVSFVFKKGLKLTIFFLKVCQVGIKRKDLCTFLSQDGLSHHVSFWKMRQTEMVKN